MDNTDDAQLQLAYQFVQSTGKNIFLTGKAGTGKTTFLHNLKNNLQKRMVIVAPTGVAAVNAGGVTMHSFFQITPGAPFIPEGLRKKDISNYNNNASNKYTNRYNRTKIAIIKSLDLLVIDEISMVRSDLLDAIDEVLRKFKDHSKPFGGVQLLMIGDLHQLAPVVKADEWEPLKNYYETMFFFSSKALQKTSYVSIELKHIYRQSDDSFIDILNSIRENKMGIESLTKLNKRHIPGFNPPDSEGYITLTTHNYQANNINDARLQKLHGSLHTFTAFVNNEFPEYSYPTHFELMLKAGAQIMFVKNDSSQEKLYYNGKIGRIVNIEDDVIVVKCPGDNFVIPVKKAEWQNVKYEIDEVTKNIKENIAGTFTQYPLKLAWAITIHKSQGLTFDKAIIDAHAAFASGQVYVALSRCRTIEGLVLSTPISNNAIKSDRTISSFTQEIERNPPGPQLLTNARKDYQTQLLCELFDFSMLQRHILYFIKLLQEHAGSIIPDLLILFEYMNKTAKTNLTEVSEKFNVQLSQLLALTENTEENEALQERVKKAATYFKDKTDNIIQQAVSGIVIETDNKVVSKLLQDNLERLGEEAFIKLSCLKSSMSGFTVKNYLETRAVASISYKVEKKGKNTTAPATYDIKEHPNLYATLKNWRNEKAAELNVEVYMIVQQKTLLELLHHLPCSIAELKSIKGFGKKTIQKWGQEIIDIIMTYCEDNNLGITPQAKGNYATEIETEKKDSKKESFNLFCKGKTVKEIATVRNLSIVTIEGHIAHYIGTGELSVKDFVSEEKIEIIKTYFLQAGNHNLTPAKHALGDNVSYSELNNVLKYLMGEGLLNPLQGSKK